MTSTQLIQRAIRLLAQTEGGKFELKEVLRLTDLDQATALTDLTFFEQAGYLERRCPERDAWRVVEDPGSLPLSRGGLEAPEMPKERAKTLLATDHMPEVIERRIQAKKQPVIDVVVAWVHDRGNERFDLDAVEAGTGLPRIKVRRVLRKLVKEGTLVIVETGQAEKSVRKPGVAPVNYTYQAARVKIQARHNRRPRKYTVRDRLWAGARALATFTRLELAEFTGCGRHSADDYCQALERSGLVTATTSGRTKIYTLLHDPGRERPATPEARTMWKANEEK